MIAGIALTAGGSSQGIAFAVQIGFDGISSDRRVRYRSGGTPSDHSWAETNFFTFVIELLKLTGTADQSSWNVVGLSHELS
jgi:hypothetical protein